VSTPAIHDSSGPGTAEVEGIREGVSSKQAYLWLTTLVVGYIGIYLCRKNLSVAIPMLQEAFSTSRAQIGLIVSYSTIAYAAGKFLFGPVVDRVGGRPGFLTSLILVALFGAMGAFAPTLAALTVLYSFNRLAGSAAWPAMVKLVPDWFGTRMLPFAMAMLSLSFVFGGVLATLFAGQLAEWSGDDWRVVMGVPSAVLVLFVVLAFFALPRGAAKLAGGQSSSFEWSQAAQLLRIRQFWVVCALSFTLTLLRETFNTWTVDFFRTEGGPEMSNRIAAFLSTPFDAFGAVGILALGWAFGRILPRTRSVLLFAILSSLAVLLYLLPTIFHQSLWLVTGAVGLIGFLTYGPYSLLAGILSVEIKGKGYVGTVSGLVDGVGYLAGILAGQQFGRIVDAGGYRLGFQSLAVLALASALLCLFLYPKKPQSNL
jgi:sugar phosphate permease